MLLHVRYAQIMEGSVGKGVGEKIANVRPKSSQIDREGDQYRVETIKKKKERKVGNITVTYNEFEQKLVKVPEKEKKKKGKKKRK